MRSQRWQCVALSFVRNLMLQRHWETGLQLSLSMHGDDRLSEIHIPACCPVLLAVCNRMAGYALAVSLSRCLLSRNATLLTHFCICPWSIPVAPAGKTVSRKARHLIPVCIPSLFSQRNSYGTPISLVHYFQLMIYVFREAFIFSSTVIDCLCDVSFRRLS